MPTDDDALRLIERYRDTASRSRCRAEDFGSLTLFVGDDGIEGCARPTTSADDPAGPTVVDAGDVRAVLARQRELGVPNTFEWIAETTTGLAEAADEAGLWVHPHSLMLHEATTAPGPVSEHPVRILEPGHALLASSLAVGRLAFADPGTGPGAADHEDLARATAAAVLGGRAPQLSARISAGETVVAVAERGGVAICTGQHNPIGTTSEIVGVGTLPVERRRGLARALTALLTADAYRNGVTTVFLAADDDDVARVYAGVGFRPVGTTMIAEPLEQV